MNVIKLCLVGLVCALFLFYATLLHAVIVNNTPLAGEDPVKQPSVELPRGVEFDVVLLKYNDDCNTKDLPIAADRVMKLVDGGRVVSYPDSYVPVIVNKDRLKEVQDRLGDQVLPLTPGLK